MTKVLQSVLVGVLILGSAIIGMFFGRAYNAYGIPAYARRLGVDCEQCHTVWPRLNAFGRKFKVKGYIDQSDNPGLPIAGRVMTTAQLVTSTPDTGAPGGEIDFPSQVNLFIGTRLTPQIGIFSAFTMVPTDNGAGGKNWVFSVDEQKYAYNFLPGKTVSAVAFHSTIFGFDPFPSLGNLAFEGDYSMAPGIMSAGELLSPFDTSGFGLAVHGFLDPKNHYYGAVGLETGGAAPDTLGLGVGMVDTSHDGLDYVARFAYTNSVGDSDGTYNIGGAYYGGGQFPTIQLPTTGNPYGYRGNVSRFFVDGALQLPIGDDRLFELIALYGTGSDRNYFIADPTFGKTGPYGAFVNGGFTQATYYWCKQFGMRATFDISAVNNFTTTGWQFGPVFLPVRDFKVNFDIGRQSNFNGNSMTYQLIMTKMI